MVFEDQSRKKQLITLNAHVCLNKLKSYLVNKGHPFKNCLYCIKPSIFFYL